MIKRIQIIHFADSKWDSEYGDSYIPLCIGPGTKAEASYFVSRVTCIRCRRLLGLKIKKKKRKELTIHLAKTSHDEKYSQPICMDYTPKKCARSVLSVRVTCKKCQKTELYKTRLAAWNRAFSLFPNSFFPNSPQ